MKRFTITVALAIMMAMPVFAERVTPETARKVAATFLNNNGAKTAQLTDLSKSAGFPNLYIFTSEQGFVVMSADDCVKPILGYSLTNTFVAEGMPENISSWLQGYSDEIQWAIDNKQRATSEIAHQWKDLIIGKPDTAKADAVVGPLIETEWNQSPYYNNFCPFDSISHVRTVTGCVATAMAQIMKYWEYPSHGIGSHSYTPENHPVHGEQYANFGETFYDWSNMPISLSSSSTAAQKNAVATLMYHCGVSVDMDYDYSQSGTSHSGSGASTEQAALAFKTYFNYSSSIEYKNKSEYDDATWMNMLIAELNANRPLQYRGKNPSSSGGHSFICDGYDKENNFHFNWGWGSACIGYFALDNLKPDNSHNYTSDQGAIFGIQPVECSASEPTNLTLTTNESNITLSWTAANGASIYNIYCNNTYIGNSTITTYSTSASFGTNAYYVRSMDTNNALSLSSNIVTNTMDYQTPIVNDLKTSFSDNNFSLSWTDPNWCYPNYSSTTLTYGEGNIFYTWPSYYYAHRYLATDLAPYANKSIYKIATYIMYPGTYTAYLYTNTSNDQPDENSLTATKSIIATGTTEWLEFTFDNPIFLSDTNDLWVVIEPENIEATYPIPSFNLSEYNENACYVSTSSPTSLTSLHYIQDYEFIISWYIKVHLTDGTYTYNLYDNGIKLNGETPISDTSYTIENIGNNTIHNYTVKTNYYGGESEASNTTSLALGSNTLASLTLENNDNMTIGSGSTLTVTGTLSNTDVANLVLEDGAQLIHNSDGVSATVKKNISPWTTNPVGGWYFIASPLTGTTSYSGEGNIVNNLITDDLGSEGSISDHTYDFYRLAYENAEPKWKNYRNVAFDMSNGQGYLYANESAQTLSFKGEIKPYNTDNNTVTVSAGWNLIGNPYTCNVVPSLAYHILNNESSTTSVNANAGLVTPGMGIAVYSENGGTLSFNLPTESMSASSNGHLQITLNQQITNRNEANTIAIDNTIVSFNENEGLPKFPLLEANSKLYIPKGKEEYAIVSSTAQGEMPLNFRAAEDGTYTLTVNPEGMEMNYLHLIDNLTGNDADLLASPDYTFEAKTTDYASRFRLVFASVCEDANDDNESFAFINDGNIVVYKEGILQIVDLMGRVLVSTDVARNVSTSGMTSGVYVLRLIDGENVKTQKIVIE